MPMSISHWMFCVTKARFDVRTRNSPVDNRGSLPARSIERMWMKNHSRKPAPRARNSARSPPLLPACRIPTTTKNMPRAERTAPSASNGRVPALAI
jgi:hypothetical protein